MIFIFNKIDITRRIELLKIQYHKRIMLVKELEKINNKIKTLKQEIINIQNRMIEQEKKW